MQRVGRALLICQGLVSVVHEITGSVELMET